MVPLKEDFGSAERHILPILVYLKPRWPEVAKQKGQQAQNQDKMLLLSEIRHTILPGFCLPGAGGHSSKRKKKWINVL